ncbi:ABC-type antimicrobial peptide transport system permease subunit [Pedobacter africanus]|uniref:ABC-type antimicrobial peptide transport system permease subunit n=1 Tax=Pedobacter africanus TaxID=151894 RepID=A0ACC6L561_9SPHI|nr:HupE/UreJ family protein [Pedobacter africanus]MDR6786548.1 ABC-type antimicrobial peptide transport system permease subunit [Pedobacter africanus]
MQEFPLYFQLGWQHILDWQGYDHILFVMALCGTYMLADWKKVLILVTAFTVGHSITLALSVFKVISVNTALIEFLIPVTILITAAANIFSKRKKPKGQTFKYLMALFFGLIHGLGFSNYLKSLLGKSSSITAELFAFNIGLEFGQILIVAGVLILSFILIWIVKIKRWDWNFFLSSAIFGISFVMAAERFPALLG